MDLQLPLPERVALLLEDYDYFVHDPALFCARLQALNELRGKAVVDAWVAQVHAGQTEQVVHDLLLLHYDPGYADSIQRNFAQYGQAHPVAAIDRHEGTFAQIAQDLRAELDPAALSP